VIQLELKQLRFAFGANSVIEPLDLRIPAGEFVCLLGPSGCGKSTLLRLMGGLLPPTQGSLTRTAGPLAFVFQDARLLPWKNVLENVLFPFAITGEQPPSAEEVLRQVGLWDYRHYFPHQLSGGMKQRVAIARALITRPQLLLMDEPFSALDESTRQELEQLLRGLWERLRMTLVFATHSLTEAVFLGERVLVMAKGGRLVRDDRVELGARNDELRSSAQLAAKARDLSAAVHAARSAK
jgi:NitT/TauT family transport system ATP-binding protein